MNNNRIFKLCLLALFLGGCAHDGDQLPEVVQIKKVSPYHKVTDGDTVGSIARKYGMKQADLIKLNNLEQPYQLYDGQRLVITPKVETTPAPSDPDVEVKVNDSNDAEIENSEEQVTEENQDGEEVKDSVEKVAAPTPEYTWPISNGKERVTRHFEGDGGIIIEASAGTPVKSIADGKVVIAGVPNGDASAYGITVVVKHSSKKTMSIYANLKEATATVGQTVKQGTIIGKVGQSGTIAKKPQLYFEINDLAGKGRRAIDPEPLLG